MGAWGVGNFQQDSALDFLWEAVQQPLRRQIDKVLADPSCAEADDPDSGPIMAAVEILALLSEQLPAAPPEPEEVARWRDAFLPAWDRTSAAIYFRPEDAAARREVIVATFARLAAAAAKWHQK